MELNHARHIVKTLANGIHPSTGEVFPEDSPYNDAEVIRALFAIHDWITPAKLARSDEERRQENRDLGRPLNYGLLWSEDDRTRVGAAFQQGLSVGEIADELQRTRSSIRSELVKQGLMEEPSYGR